MANNNTLVSLFHQGGNWSRDTLAGVSDDEAILDLEAEIKGRSIRQGLLAIRDLSRPAKKVRPVAVDPLRGRGPTTMGQLQKTGRTAQEQAAG